MAAIKAFGSDIFKGNGTDYNTATTWTSVGCVTSITPPNPSVSDVEVPKCVNATSLAKEYVPGSYDPGEAAYTILYTAGSVQQGLDDLGDYGCWRIKLGTTTTQKFYAFNGYFKGISMPEITSEGFLSLTTQMKVSGEPKEVTGT